MRHVLGLKLTHDEKLVTREFSQGNRGMGRDKGLQWGALFLRAESIEEADDPMRFEPVFEFIDQDDGRLLGCLALQARDEEPGRTEPEAAQGNAMVVMQ